MKAVYLYTFICFLLVYASITTSQIIDAADYQIFIEYDYELYQTVSYIRFTIENPRSAPPLPENATVGKLLDISLPNLTSSIIFNDIRCNIDSEEQQFINIVVSNFNNNTAEIFYNVLKDINNYLKVSCVIPLKASMTPKNSIDNEIKIVILATGPYLYTQSIDLPTVDNPSPEPKSSSLSSFVTVSMKLPSISADHTVLFSVFDETDQVKSPQFVRSGRPLLVEFSIPMDLLIIRPKNAIIIDFPFKIENIHVEENMCLGLVGSLYNNVLERNYYDGEFDINNGNTYPTSLAFSPLFDPTKYPYVPLNVKRTDITICKFTLFPWVRENEIAVPKLLQFKYRYTGYDIPTRPAIKISPDNLPSHDDFYRTFPTKPSLFVLPPEQFFYSPSNIMTPYVSRREIVTATAPYVRYIDDDVVQGTAPVSNRIDFEIKFLKLDYDEKYDKDKLDPSHEYTVVLDVPKRMGYLPNSQGKYNPPVCNQGLIPQPNVSDSVDWVKPYNRSTWSPGDLNDSYTGGTPSPAGDAEIIKDVGESYLRFEFKTTKRLHLSIVCELDISIQPALSDLYLNVPIDLAFRLLPLTGDENDIDNMQPIQFYHFVTIARYLPSFQIHPDQDYPFTAPLSGGIVHIHAAPRTYHDVIFQDENKKTYLYPGLALDVRGPSVSQDSDLQILYQRSAKNGSPDKEDLPASCISCFKLTTIQRTAYYTDENGVEIGRILNIPRLVLGEGDYTDVEFEIAVAYVTVYDVEMGSYTSIPDGTNGTEVETKPGLFVSLYHVENKIDQFALDSKSFRQPELQIVFTSQDLLPSKTYDIIQPVVIDVNFTNLATNKYDQLVLNQYAAYVSPGRSIPCYPYIDNVMRTDLREIFKLTVTLDTFVLTAAQNNIESLNDTLKTCRIIHYVKALFPEESKLNSQGGVGEFYVRSALVQEYIPDYAGSVHKSDEFYHFEIKAWPVFDSATSPLKAWLYVATGVSKTSVFSNSITLLEVKVINIDGFYDTMRITLPQFFEQPAVELVELSQRFITPECPYELKYDIDGVNTIVDITITNVSSTPAVPTVCQFFVMNRQQVLSESGIITRSASIIVFKTNDDLSKIATLCGDHDCDLSILPPALGFTMTQIQNTIFFTIILLEYTKLNPGEVVLLNLPPFSRVDDECIRAGYNYPLSSLEFNQGLGTLHVTPDASTIQAIPTGVTAICTFTMYANLPVSSQSAYMFYYGQLVRTAATLPSIPLLTSMPVLPAAGLDITYSQTYFSLLNNPTSTIFLYITSQAFYTGDEIIMYLPRNTYWIPPTSTEYTQSLSCNTDTISLSQQFFTTNSTYSVTATILQYVDPLAITSCSVQIGYRAPQSSGYMKAIYRHPVRDSSGAIIPDSNTGFTVIKDTLYQVPFTSISSKYSLKMTANVEPVKLLDGTIDNLSLPNMVVVFNYTSTLLPAESNVLMMDVTSWRIQNPQTKIVSDTRELACHLLETDILDEQYDDNELRPISHRFVSNYVGEALRIALPPVKRNELIRVRCNLPLAVVNRGQYITPIIIEGGTRKRFIASYDTPDFAPGSYSTRWTPDGGTQQQLDLRQTPLTRIMFENSRLYNNTELDLMVTIMYKILRSKDESWNLNSIIIMGQYPTPVVEDDKRVVMVTFGFADVNKDDSLLRTRLAGIDFVRYLSNSFKVYLDPVHSPELLLNDSSLYNYSACPLDPIQTQITRSCGPSCGRSCTD